MLEGNYTAELLVDEIKLPLSIVFICLNMFLGITCIIGNLLAMVIMIKAKDTSFSTKLVSTWILFHLALSAFFIGIWALICGTHLLTDGLRRNIWIDHVRRFFGIIAPGTLILLLGCISYDRYILLKHHKNHYKYMTKKKTFSLIALCWIIPLPVPFIRYLNHVGFYLLVAGAIIIVFIILIVAYSFIIKLVFKSERKVKRMRLRGGGGCPLQQSSLTELTINSGEASSIEMNQKTQTAKDNERIPCSNPSTKSNGEFSRLRKTLRLAKTVSKLLSTYLVFHLPMLCYLLVRTIKPNLMNKREQEIALLLVEIFSQINATLVPLVYFTSITVYKKGFKKMLCLRKSTN